MVASISDEAFRNELARLREDYSQCRETSNLYPPKGRPILDLVITSTVRGDRRIDTYSYWFEEPDSTVTFVRLYDIPTTLSGNILRLRQNLPAYHGDLEIDGDQVCALQHAPPLPCEPDNDDEDVTSELARVPFYTETQRDTFVKKSRYCSEIRNLLKVRGREHIVELLGKTETGMLVFPKHSKPYAMFSKATRIEQYKSWILQLLYGLRTLHRADIVHRDLKLDNLLASPGDCLIICDLESRWGNRQAPEVLKNDSLNAGWSEKSDIWDLGRCIESILYANNPINLTVERPVPAPFSRVAAACLHPSPDHRATLDELIAMVEAISSSE